MSASGKSTKSASAPRKTPRSKESKSSKSQPKQRFAKVVKQRKRHPALTIPRNKPRNLFNPKSGIHINPLFPSVEEGAYAAIGTHSARRTLEMHGDIFSGIRVHARIPFAQAIDSSSLTSGGIAQPGLGLGCYIGNPPIINTGSVNCTTLSPVYGYAWGNTSPTGFLPAQAMSVWISPVLANIAANFSKYRVSSLTFHYEPNALTSQERSYVFAYSNDPLSIVTGLRSGFLNLDTQAGGPTAVNGTNQQYPSLNTLDSTCNSILFQAWMGWSMTVPVTDVWKYTACKYVYQTTPYGFYNSADVRDTQFGSVACLNLTGNDSGTGFGTFWIELDIEFADPTPNNPGQTIPLPGLTGVVDTKQEDKTSESKEPKVVVDPVTSVVTLKVDEDDDYLTPSPPKYKPAPSADPGTANYVTTASLLTPAKRLSKK